MYDKNKVGKRIAAKRKEMGLTQTELAKAVGYKAGCSISILERGKSLPNEKVLNTLADVLNVPAQWILTGELERRFDLYTDGGCACNPGGPGGYGVVIVEKGTGAMTELSGGFQATTNNRMEIMAAIVGLEHLPSECNVTVFSDSQYLVATMNGEFSRGKNIDLWQRLDRAINGKKVSFHWVRGHNGNPMNERCDELATQAIANAPKIPDTGYVHISGPKGASPKTGAMGVGINVPIELNGAPPVISSPSEFARAHGISYACATGIQKFYTKPKHRFSDYLGLKTYGVDSWSRMGSSQLAARFGKEKWDLAQEILHDDVRTTSCLRWHGRGLTLEDSIRKELASAEVSRNAIGSKRGWPSNYAKRYELE